MKKKNNWFKNILFVCFAFSMFSAGMIAINAKQQIEQSSAENVSTSTIDNQNIPDYFSAVEYLSTSNESDSAVSPYVGSLIDEYDTFMHFSEGDSTNFLSLSLKTNGNIVNKEASAIHKVYENVYYPDETNLSIFNYYQINNINLYINGLQQSISLGDFTTQTGLSFTNNDSAGLDNFEMIFNKNSTKSNEISIFDEAGQVIEGVYTLSLSLTLWTCYDGGTSQNEESFDDRNVTIDYSFYVVDRENYFSDNIARVQFENFDHAVTVSNLTNPNYSRYLYNNFSSETSPNKLAYIDYDYTRFEVEITKEFSNKIYKTELMFDLDTNTPIQSGQEIVRTYMSEENKNICRLYFTDVGEYSIKFKDIKLIKYGSSLENNTVQKHSLNGLTSLSKKFMVYVYGYQAHYTDLDGELDENKIRPTKELKDFDFKNSVYVGADITSSYLNSNESYSQDNGNTTFTISNVLNYLNTNPTAPSPVKTNQTPIKFVSNATIKNGVSNYIYTTNKLSNAYETQIGSINLGGKTLYRTSFNGRTESSAGTYIYILAYTYKNYYQSEASLNSIKTFYQIFYFEITKELPSIEIKTSSTAKEIYSGSFVNENVDIIDTTKTNNLVDGDKTFNKDVTIQIYAKDYVSRNYMDKFGGSFGISFDNLVTDDANKITLEDNAFYTIRLYFTNELSGISTSIDSKKGYFREQTFTIDTLKISGITGKNYVEISNSTNYKFSSNMDSFTTNQSFALSWDNKTSGAQTYAYYRYFPMIETTFYSQNTANASSLIENMLTSDRDKTWLPINYTLDFSTNSNVWLPYEGNTVDKTTISSEYILTDAGFYLVDIFDEAGNHSIEVFMIDKTKPVFAMSDESSYALTNSSMYVTKPSTLYWAKYKAIYMQNFTTLPFNSSYTPETITVNDLIGYDFYKNSNNAISTDIFIAMFNKLKENNYMQYINCETPVDDTVGVASYSGNYITIPINEVSYFLDGNRYVSQNGIYRKDISVENQQTYVFLIRDLSNTKYVSDYTIDKNAEVQYTNHYSAKQTIIVSFDDSEFAIGYMNDDKEFEILSSNNSESGTIDVHGTERTTLKTYLSPTGMEKEFSISIYPTKTDGDLKIQVDEVSIKYYSYVARSIVENGISYHYYDLSDSATEIIVYKYNGQNSSVDLKIEPIRLNSEGFTTAGKYEITRTYSVESPFSYNENDSYQKTFVFYVDRNKVISNADLVTNEDGSSHLESLVGGDVFVSMYDNKTETDLVVTFPNSPDGNTNGSSLYNNGIVKSVLTTNMLPVYVYVPQYKYTKYSQKTELTDGYDFEVNYDFDNDNQTNKDDMNFYSANRVISEYALYAELMKDNSVIAKTSTNWTDPKIETVVSNANGFLKFYKQDGTELNFLSEEGTYYVTIYQGRFLSSATTNAQQSITFCFNIIRSNPDFEVQTTTGSYLNFDDQSSTYYTNQSKVNLIWEAGSTYMAEIDIEKISFETSNNTQNLTINQAFDAYPTISNGMYFASLNLDKLQVYNNEGWVKVTMQYKNHNDDFYTKITKTIAVDLSAPNTNINKLVNMSTSGNIVSALSNNALRTYYTEKMQVTSNLDETCFNVSNNTGTFAYYSYNVESSFLKDLKTVSASKEGYKTYIKEFVGKYSPEIIQETSPANFMASNFDDIDNITALSPNKYYEVVETDKAGNMTIYTIYVVNYLQSEIEEQNNLLTYADQEGNLSAYTIEDYLNTLSYSGAQHNIYSKTGFDLKNINFFGDAWAQFKFTSVNVNGYPTTLYLMLTPWDKDYAYAFVGNNITKIAISDLIDGQVSSRYKHCLSFYNRQNGAISDFYVNIRNTTLIASMTNDRNREYISFPLAMDQTIQNTTYSSTYVKELKITADNQLIYHQKNNNGFASLWQSNTNVTVTSNATLGTLVFEINENLGFAPNTIIVYEYTDNYNTLKKEIHLYKETVVLREVSSAQDLYSYYDNTGNLYYITKNGFKYLFNPNKYKFSIFDMVDGEISEELTKATYSTATDLSNVTTVTIETNSETGVYNDSFALVVNDLNNDYVKTIYFTLYNQLPTANITTNNNRPGEFKLLNANKNNITQEIINNSTGMSGYYSSVTLLYSNQITFLPIKYSISLDKINWQEISSGTVLKNQTSEMQVYYLKIWYDESYLVNENGNSSYVFENVPESQIYQFNLSSLTSTFWIEKTVDGQTTIIEKSNTIYITPTGQQFANHYIVNLSYQDKDYVEIKTNQEQGITKTLVETYSNPSNSAVTSERWLISNRNQIPSGNTPDFHTTIIITYIPSSDSFVDEFYTYNTNGIIDTSENLINMTSKSIVISEENSSISRIELQWSKYYGIPENEINIKLAKDGIELIPTVYTRRSNNKEYNYIYITHSGKYSISLYDNSGNIQKFNRGNAGQTESMSFIFLKDVPFTISYTDIQTGQEQTSMPINQAVYNGNVFVNIEKSTLSEFYTLDGYPVISITKNGEAISAEDIEEFYRKDSATARRYNFTEAGYYEISFVAKSNLPDVGEIRHESYQFTILNANEYRYSYVYNQYSNYYVEKVVKNGSDITQTLVRTLGIPSISIDGIQYLTSLPLSYLDEKTGFGTYLITINSNDRMYKASTMPTNWTFQVIIQQGTAPILVSISEGKGTTKKVDIVYNSANIYQEMGECQVRILFYNSDGVYRGVYYENSITAESTQEQSTSIDSSEIGTFYLQIVSPSGNLLYSYKILKEEPMNPATIIIIVVAVILAVVIAFIVYKLRKKISVK